jgi:hypothetical protein
MRGLIFATFAIKPSEDRIISEIIGKSFLIKKLTLP